MKEEISCVCLRRNLLCFGTISGAILLLRQTDLQSCDPYTGNSNILNCNLIKRIIRQEKIEEGGSSLGAQMPIKLILCLE